MYFFFKALYLYCTSYTCQPSVVHFFWIKMIKSLEKKKVSKSLCHCTQMTRLNHPPVVFPTHRSALYNIIIPANEFSALNSDPRLPSSNTVTLYIELGVYGKFIKHVYNLNR